METYIIKELNIYKYLCYTSKFNIKFLILILSSYFYLLYNYLLFFVQDSFISIFEIITCVFN